jgi:perosamine synthetase
MTKTIPQMEPWFDKSELYAVNQYLRNGDWLTEYKKTEELEKMICLYTGAKYCVMTTSGTVSLILALLALNLKAGNEVLIPNLTMIATANAAVLLNIKPVLVDIEPETLCLDIKKAQGKITAKTKALIYVALNGRSANMDQITAFCKKNNLHLIEDAAQTLGSFWKKKHLGTFGTIGCLSFSVPKIITTGQGGAILTNKHSLYTKVRKLKDFGRERGGTDIHNFWGWNFKFNDLLSVIGLAQMKKLAWRVKRKKEIYSLYSQKLKGIKEVGFIPTNLGFTAPWFIDIYVGNPDKLAAYLAKKGIGTRRVYPPISSQKIYRKKVNQEKFPVSEKYASRGLWLPSSSKLTNQEIEKVTSVIKKYYNAP